MKLIMRYLLQVVLLFSTLFMFASSERAAKLKLQDYASLNSWGAKLEQFQKEVSIATTLSKIDRKKRRDVLIALGCQLLNDSSFTSKLLGNSKKQVFESSKKDLDAICRYMLNLSEHKDPLPIYETSPQRYIHKMN